MALTSPKAPPQAELGGAGDLSFIRPGAKTATLCALKRTSVDADVAGFGARVTVVQTFHNPCDVPVEAIYKFPLPDDAAINRMRIQIGNRVIEGELKKREDAQAVYEAAKNAGQTAALLNQERTNFFTQSIANLTPGADVKVEISYVQTLKYEDGQFELHYPMTIGPRYMGAGTPDPGKISTIYNPPETRTGANIDLHVHVQAGAPIQSIRSVLHKVKVQRDENGGADVQLSKADEIPNRDFILKYSVATGAIQSACVSHYDSERGGYFALTVMPPKQPEAAQIGAKELIFVMDQSGSQSGFPIEKSKELTLKLIEQMRPNDTFNVMGFSNDVRRLWPEPRPNTPANRAAAATFVKAMSADGGTELGKAVIAALSPAADPHRLRYVVFNTDGYVGQDREIIDAVRQYRRGARLFAFGIGNSVNRALIDAMSTEGRGDSDVVTLPEDADDAVKKFVKRTTNPILTNVSVSCPDATEVTPTVLPDVLADKPIVVYGRYDQAREGHFVIQGTLAGKPWSKAITVPLSGHEDDDKSIESLWARNKIDDVQRNSFIDDLHGRSLQGATTEKRVTEIALSHGVMSDFTSFVAVERRVVNVGGKQRTVNVPLEAPEGVDLAAAGGSLAGAGRAKFKAVASHSSMYRSQSPGGRGASSGGMGGGLLQGNNAPVPSVAKAEESLRDGQEMSASKIATSLQKVKSGKVSIQIGLKDLKPETLAKLEKLGFHLDAKLEDLKVVIGTVEAKALVELAKLDEVKTIVEDK